jgi:hypothetical protein
MFALFLFDCSQWKVVWNLFDSGGKQSQCPLGGLRKLENIDVSSSSLQGTYYAHTIRNNAETGKKIFSLSYEKRKPSS